MATTTAEKYAVQYGTRREGFGHVVPALPKEVATAERGRLTVAFYATLLPQWQGTCGVALAVHVSDDHERRVSRYFAPDRRDEGMRILAEASELGIDITG